MDVQHRVSLWVEGGESSLGDEPTGIKLNHAVLDGIRVGDLLEVVPPTGVGQTAGLKRATRGPGLLFHVPPAPQPDEYGSVKQAAPHVLSIPYHAAKAFELDRLNRSEVVIRKVPAPTPREYCVEHIELFMRDEYLGRSEMLRIVTALANTPVYVGKDVGLAPLKIRTRVGRLYIEGKRMDSGYVTPFTNVVFRSESAKYYIFVQVSREMWTFEEDGGLYHEKAVLFLEDLFMRWSKIGTNHLVTLVLFSRVFYSAEEAKTVPPPVLTSETGRHYKDVYRVIVDLEPTLQWHRLLAAVRQEISRFQFHALTFVDAATLERRMAGRLSNAHEGNILEAMGIACNSFDDHYIDRDLRRTGVSIVFVTAGTCVFDVEQLLLRLTVERFIDHGIGVDFVSLSKVPLHVIPLFRFRAPDIDAEASDDPDRRLDASRNPVYVDADPSAGARLATFYNVPFFVDCSFFSRHQDRPFRIDRFMPRCRMPQVQRGIGEHDLTGIQLPLLSDELHATAYDEDARKRRLARLKFDATMADHGAAKRSTAVTKPIVPRRRVTSSASSATPTKAAVAASSQVLPKAGASRPSIPRSASSTTGVAPAVSAKDRATSASATPALIARLTKAAAPPPPSPAGLGSVWPWSRTEPAGGTTSISRVTAGASSTRLSSTASTSRDRSRPALSTPSEAGAARSKPISIRDASRGSTVEGVRDKVKVERPDRFNPSNPSVPSRGLLSQARRWTAIFPRAHNDQRSLKWKSLTTPACLPLTTDFQPSPHELDTLYALQEYSLPIAASSMLVKVQSAQSEPTFWRDMAVGALREAVSQRLCQAFQIVVPALSGYARRLDPSSRPIGGSLAGILREAEKGKGAYVDLSLSDHYHRIRLLDPDTSKASLHVQIFVRHREWSAMPYEYEMAVWPGSDEEEAPATPWQARRLRFEFPDLDSFDFRLLDSIVVGLEKPASFSDRLRYWRTRLAFLPSAVTRRDALPRDVDPSASDDEVRLAGMLKLGAHLQLNVVWRNQPDGSAGSGLDFTTLDSTQLVRQESDRLIEMAARLQGEREKAGRVLKDDSLESIAEAMLHPVHGVDIRTRRWQVRAYEDVFTGDRLVTFLRHQFELATRDEAVALGQDLQQKGLFRSIADPPKQLADGFFYYELCAEYAPAKAPRTSWFGRTERRDERRGRNSTPDSKRSRSASRQRKPPRPRIEMTRVGVIDVDPGSKSERSEKAFVHCDISHSPANAWHVEVHWMGITSLLVDAMMASWSRTVERYGVKMVEESARSFEAMAEGSPLQTTFEIRLARRPPPVSDFADRIGPSPSSHAEWFEGQLLREQGFVLDAEATHNFPTHVEVVYSYHRGPVSHSQYVHRTGLALVQVREGALLWTDNLASRTSSTSRGRPPTAAAAVAAAQTTASSSQQAQTGTGTGLTTTTTVEARTLRRRLTELCRDEARLQACWDRYVDVLTADADVPPLATGAGGGET